MNPFGSRFFCAPILSEWNAHDGPDNFRKASVFPALPTHRGIEFKMPAAAGK
jgi:hypothetical protein